MKETGILFKPDMVKAILENRKTQTRRLIKDTAWLRDCEFDESGPIVMDEYGEWHPLYCPYGGYGDRLYVKKNRFTSKAKAELWLEITGVRVERLQDITEEDAKMEGIKISPTTGAYLPGNYYRAIWAFKELWQSIYGHDSWNQNPWVWVIEFKKVDV